MKIEFSWGLRHWRVLQVKTNKAMIKCTSYDYSPAFWITLDELQDMLAGREIKKVDT